MAQEKLSQAQKELVKDILEAEQHYMAQQTTPPVWKRMDAGKPIVLMEYYYLRRKTQISKEYISSTYEWNELKKLGYTHYLTESDLLSLQKEK